MRCAIELNGTSVKYDWMLLMVRVHHPGGVTQNDKAAYAYDWKEWTNALRLIYSMILKNCESDISSKSFVQLACEGKIDSSCMPILCFKFEEYTLLVLA